MSAFNWCSDESWGVDAGETLKNSSINASSSMIEITGRHLGWIRFLCRRESVKHTHQQWIDDDESKPCICLWFTWSCTKKKSLIPLIFIGHRKTPPPSFFFFASARFPCLPSESEKLLPSFLFSLVGSRLIFFSSSFSPLNAEGRHAEKHHCGVHTSAISLSLRSSLTWS